MHGGYRGKRESLPVQKRKRESPGADIFTRISPHIGTARTHARATRNETISRFALQAPTSVKLIGRAYLQAENTTHTKQPNSLSAQCSLVYMRMRYFHSERQTRNDRCAYPLCLKNKERQSAAGSSQKMLA